MIWIQEDIVMKKRQFTCAITFLVTPVMYQEIKSASDSLEVGVSDFLRQAAEDKLKQKSHESTSSIKNQECSEKDREDGDTAEKRDVKESLAAQASVQGFSKV